MMRIVRAALLCLLALPVAQAGAVNPKSQCKNTCSSSYTLCMKRSNTKVTRKACKAQHKTCKKGCRG
jgi:hypothetical protein